MAEKARPNSSTRQLSFTADVKALSEKFHQTVTGFAFPYGVGASKSREALKAAGIKYARLATSKPGFRFPEDPLAMPLSCWHISPKTFELLDDFIHMEAGDEDAFFLMFAHGYEFDFGTKESNWDKFRRICETVANCDEIIGCSIGDAFRMHEEK